MESGSRGVALADLPSNLYANVASDRSIHGVQSRPDRPHVLVATEGIFELQSNTVDGPETHQHVPASTSTRENRSAERVQEIVFIGIDPSREIRHLEKHQAAVNLKLPSWPPPDVFVGREAAPARSGLGRSIGDLDLKSVTQCRTMHVIDL